MTSMKLPILGGAAVAAVLGSVIATAGVAQSTPTPVPVADTPATVRAAVPALTGKGIPIPGLVKRAFDNAPNQTANGALARPLAAKMRDGSVSWVAPTADGACLGVPDPEVGAIGVVCATTAEIERGNLAIQSYSGDPETSTGIEVGVDAKGAVSSRETDGSFVRQTK